MLIGSIFTVIIYVFLFILFAYSYFKVISILGSTGLLLMIILSCSLVVPIKYIDNNFYMNHVQITKENIKYPVSFLPNQIVNSQINTFIVDGHEFQVDRAPNVLYAEDSKANPYIVVEKSTYKVNPVWYMSTWYVEDTNSKIDRKLKEIHH